MASSWKTIIELQRQMARRLADEGRRRSQHSGASKPSTRLLQQQIGAFGFHQTPSAPAVSLGMEYMARMFATDSSSRDQRSQHVHFPPTQPLFDLPSRLGDILSNPLLHLAPKKGTGTFEIIPLHSLIFCLSTDVFLPRSISCFRIRQLFETRK